jgi:hypothetical protein
MQVGLFPFHSGLQEGFRPVFVPRNSFMTRTGRGSSVANDGLASR